MTTPHSLTTSAPRGVGPEIRTELERQNPSPLAATRRSLSALAEPGVCTAVTGQQVGLFLGPAYSFYKAATAIVAARRQTAAGESTVPIFWLQSEDHDAAEVATCCVLDDDDELAEITLLPEGAPRSSLGERLLGAGARDAIDRLGAALGAAPHADEALALLSRHYVPEASWADAFAGVLLEVFGEDGLLVLDPRAKGISELAASVHHRALDDVARLDEALAEGAAIPREAGEEVGVPPRRGCALSFFHPDGPGGARFRPERIAHGWQLPNGTVMPHAVLLEALSRAPRTFSTSCLLRVVLQQHLLPHTLQIAGPGESRYLRQTPPLLDAFEVSRPRVMLRARMVLVDPRCRRRLQALGIAAEELIDRDALLARLAEKDPGIGGEEARNRLLSTFDRELDALTEELTALDAGLEAAASRTRRHVHKGVEKLGARVTRARMRRDEDRIARIDYLTARLAPRGAPQERVLSFPHFVARYSLAEFKRRVFDTVDAHLESLAAGATPVLHEIEVDA